MCVKGNTALTNPSTLHRRAGSKSLLIAFSGKTSWTHQFPGILLRRSALLHHLFSVPLIWWLPNLLSSGEKYFYTLTSSFPPSCASAESLLYFRYQMLRSFLPYLTRTLQRWTACHIDLYILTAPGRAGPCLPLHGELCWDTCVTTAVKLTFLPVSISATITDNLLPLPQSSTSLEINMKILPADSEARHRDTCEHNNRLMSRQQAPLTPQLQQGC